MGKENSQVPSELIRFIKDGTKFIIVGHKEPDGDCIGSQLTLRSVLLRMGKEVIVCSEGPFQRTELKNYTNHFVKTLSEKDKLNARVIVVDCSGIERVGDLHKSLKGLPVAVIDHHAAVTHPPSTEQAPVYVDANSPSCTFLVEKLINTLGIELTKDEAQLLLFGLCTDTGFFRHLTDKHGEVFESVARMTHRGANPKQAYQIMSGGKSLSSRLLIGHVLTKAESFFDGKLLVSHETLEEYKKYGFESRDSDSLNRMLLSIEGVQATAIIRQESEDNCTISLRSVDTVDVAQIASSFGGGGHKNASGFTMRGNVSNVKQKIIESFSTLFKFNN